MRTTIALSYERYDDRLAKSFDGVGLIRSEYIFHAIGHYPTDSVVKENVVPYLLDTALLAQPHRVWYRTLEVDTAEANVLNGVDEILVEKDRLLGLRGIRRSIAYPEAFRSELKGIAEARKAGADIGIIIPFVTYIDEIDWAVQEIRITALAHQSHQWWKLLRAINKAREMTWHIGAELAIAGYLSPELMQACRTLGVDECVVHYSDLPTTMGEEWSDLPDLHILQETKTKTSEAINRFNKEFGVDQRIY